MATERLAPPSFVPGPPVLSDDDRDLALPDIRDDGKVAPLRRMDRGWLVLWSGNLETTVSPPVSGVDAISSLLNGPSTTAAPPGRWRWMTPAGGSGATAPQAPPAPPAQGGRPPVGEAIEPRSMTAAPIARQGQMRRTAELLAVLSACLDPAERRPAGHAVRTAYLGTRMAAELGLADEVRSDLIYAGLLRDAGSLGLEPEDHPLEEEVPRGRRGRPRSREAPPGGAIIIPSVADPSGAPSHLSKASRAAAMVRVLGLPQGVLEAVTSIDERWDGRGPRRERRTAIPLGARIAAVAHVAATAAVSGSITWAYGSGGPATHGASSSPSAQALTPSPSAVERALKHERGRVLEPELVDAAIRLGRAGLWTELAEPELVERLLELEPAHRLRISDDIGIDTIAGAFADLVDTRTPKMGRHGRRVAGFAVRTAVTLGMEPRLQDDLRRAALLHDVGKLIVPIAWLEKPGELSDHERRIIGEHARAGATVLERSRVLASLAPLIIAHHERLDGTGLFPSLDDDRAMIARLIALSDRFEAMTAERPWRPPMTPAQAWSTLREVATDPLAAVALAAMERTLTGD